MEKGLKALQSTARTAQRKASADHQSNSHSQSFCAPEDRDRGISDHNSDSGIVLCSGSEPDLDATEERRASISKASVLRHGASASWSESHNQHLHQEHLRSRSLPLPLPQYQPPMPVARVGGVGASVGVSTAQQSSAPISHGNPAYASQRYSPERLSIQAVLSPEEPADSGVSYDSRTRRPQ
jgi:hypothetical protein